ncbi:Protein nrde2 [Monascus purpureus]|uniref:Protein nrde2 n=1 Tax=Monascus purpureus TaxID=5098 RepID=A0A507R610_MONPU|nr:Protein nrde2 [Monascus purpureus]BDD55700.1 hypothetical protein MAP00_001189 [Monascus purpureus]
MDSSGSQEKKSIPRFTSFKPKPAPPPEVNRPHEHRDREKLSRDEKSRHNSRHRSHRERRADRREHRHHRRDDHSSTSRRVEPIVNEPPQPETDLYIVDLKGDKYNLVYGTLHRYSVPEYRRIGRGRVLGLPPSYRIDRDSTEGDAVVIRTDTWRADATRAKTRSVFSKQDRRPARYLRVRKDVHTDPTDASKDFLPLNIFGKRKRSASLGRVDSEDEKYAYRSIHGKAKPEDVLPSEFEVVSESESDDEEKRRIDLEDEVKQQNAEFSRAVEQNPHDVAAWLRLIHHQDALLGGAVNESRPLSYAENMSLADIKLSLYKKALKRVGDTPSKDRLLLGLLEEGSKLWDTKKLSEQWQDTLKNNAGFISLWIKYLDFRQTEFLDFTYDRCMAAFVDCLKLNVSSPDSREKVYIQTYLLLRLTAFMREAGFTDHAVGLWQAILEFNVFQPDELNQSSAKDQALSAFREFWESEVARIGDAGAKGWKSDSSAPVEPKMSTSKFHVDRRSVFASWSVCERERIINARMPARSLDESDEDDPYRVVIFSDLQELLSQCWGLELKDALIDGFLYYCHLPPLLTPDNTETTRRWGGDNFLRNELIDNPEFTLNNWLPRLNTDTEDPAISPVLFLHNNLIHTTDILFGRHQQWFSSFSQWTSNLDGRSDIDTGWVRRTLRMLAEANPTNDGLAEYALAFESACDTKDAKKYAKSLLKKRSSSLRLYNAYALMECRTGSRAAAEHVWATALSMSTTFPDHDRIECALLWCTWLWELLWIQDNARASHLLLSMPQNNVDLKSFPETLSQAVFSPTGLLKIRSFLVEAQENALSVRNAGAFVANVDCLAILSYLAHNLDLDNALEAYNAAVKRLSSLPMQATTFKSFTTELIHQSRSKLLYHHVRTRGTYRPARIRELLVESISHFPHNTVFLSLFTWNESRFRIEGRVRDVLEDVTTKTSEPTDQDSLTATTQQIPVTSHLFAIYTELNRPIYTGSTVYSVRAAFEKAIGETERRAGTRNTVNNTTKPTNASAKSNLSIWKLYILFELAQNDIQRAKDVFYRAIRACPWAKELIMLAFSHLRADVVNQHHPKDYSNKDVRAALSGPIPRRGDGMDFHELHRVYNVLVEKELRVHVDIEGLLDEMVMDMSRDGHGGAAGISFGRGITMPEDKESESEIENEYE